MQIIFEPGFKVSSEIHGSFYKWQTRSAIKLSSQSPVLTSQKAKLAEKPWSLDSWIMWFREVKKPLQLYWSAPYIHIMLKENKDPHNFSASLLHLTLPTCMGTCAFSVLMFSLKGDFVSKKIISISPRSHRNQSKMQFWMLIYYFTFQFKQLQEAPRSDLVYTHQMLLNINM